MLHRLAPLALVLLAACSRAPDYSGCRLVGRWTYELSMTERSTAFYREQGRDPARVQEEHIEKQRKDGCGEFFLADGTYIMKGFIFEHPFENRGTWSVVSEDGARLSISIPEPKAATGIWSRTFEFESADVMREVGGQMDGSTLRRLPD
jgi:hypothetical protein